MKSGLINFPDYIVVHIYVIIDRLKSEIKVIALITVKTKFIFDFYLWLYTQKMEKYVQYDTFFIFIFFINLQI